MNLLISEHCINDLINNDVPASTSEVAHLLSSLDPTTFKTRPDVSRLSGTNEEIYVLRYKSIRLFFTYSEENLVLIGTTCY